MRHMSDEIATILAGPQPRRKTLKLLTGLLVGGLLSGVGNSANAQTTCGGKKLKAGETCCGGTVVCAQNKTCCTSGGTSGPKGAKVTGSSFCISLTKQCGNSQPV